MAKQIAQREPPWWFRDGLVAILAVVVPASLSATELERQHLAAPDPHCDPHLGHLPASVCSERGGPAAAAFVPCVKSRGLLLRADRVRRLELGQHPHGGGQVSTLDRAEEVGRPREVVAVVPAHEALGLGEHVPPAQRGDDTRVCAAGR
ncbi:hypothetical protein ACGFIU_16415 [Rhodococcus oryzae]|uniref:hypothetical protein n=1 Tax=Rhodococcus oryzae TaxID=2571143 RepID=UPI003721F782